MESKHLVAIGTHLRENDNQFTSEFLEAIYGFIASKESDNTKWAYYGDLLDFFSWASVKDPRQIKRNHIIAYKNMLAEKYSTATVARRVTTLRSFYRWLEEIELIRDNPTKHVHAPKQDALYGKTPEINDAQVRLLLAAPNRDKPTEFRDFVMLQMLYYLGLRVSELVNIRIDDISQESGQHVLEVRGKGNQLRRMPVKPFIVHDIEEYKLLCKSRFTSADAYLFQPSRNNRTGVTNKPLTTGYVWMLVQRYAERAGIESKMCVHTARVTACGHALERGASELEILNLFGWRTSEMIRRYDRRRNSIRTSAAHRIAY